MSETSAETTPRPSDEQLLASFQESGQASAAEDLVRRHLPRVNAIVYQMVLDESVADDVTQEVFLRALRSLSGFRRDAKFSTWLCRVALNTTYNYLNSMKNQRIQYRADLSEGRSHEPLPEDSVLAVELDGQIQAALSELSPKLRAAIVLTSIEGFDAREAARIEGCTTPTMYWRVHQARRKLRHRLRNWLSP